MKKSEKLSLAVSAILFVFAALFSIALLSQLFGAGGKTAFHSLGALLFGAYGAGSALIPIFLLAAGILSFLPTWSIRRWLMLAASIVPFFTIIITEKFCAGFSKEGDLLGAVKIGVAVVICVLCLILEYLSCCIAADSLDRWIFEHFSADDGEKNENKDEVSEADSSITADEEKSAEVSSASEPVEQKKEEIPPSSSDEKEAQAEVQSEEAALSNTSKNDTESKEVKKDEVPETIGSADEAQGENTEPKSEVKSENVKTAENSAIEEQVLEPQKIKSAEEIGEKAAVTTAMFSVSEEEIEKAREAEREELQKKKLIQKFDSEPTVRATSAQSVMETTEIANDDDSFVIVPVAEDEAAFITDETDEFSKIPESSNIIDLSGNTDYFSKSSEESYYGEGIKESGEEKKPSVFDKAIEAVDERAKLAQAKDSLDEDFFDIDMNAEDDDEKEAREEREKTMLSYEERPVIMESIETVTVGEFDKSVSEVLNPVFEKMEKDVQASLPEISPESKNTEPDEQPALESTESFDEKDEEIAENEEAKENAPEKEQEPDKENLKEIREPVLDAVLPRPSLLQTAIQMQDAKSAADEAGDSAEEIEEQGEGEGERGEESTVEDTKEPPIAVNPVEQTESDEEPSVATEKQAVAEAVKKPYAIPTDILTAYSENPYWEIDDETKQAAENLKNTLSEFKIDAEVTGICKGPVVTMFEMLPAPGVKLSKIVALQDNIALRLAAKSVRIVAPIPGKRAVGIEVPNKERAVVSFREIIEENNPAWTKMAVPVILGKDISGESKIMDLVKTPHLLIAGATGAGKSVCVNSLILSILYKRSPEQVRLILIDPKIVELKLYNDIPHLLTPVITEPKKAFQALQYCLCEMERRYSLLDGMQVRDIENYNKRIEERNIATEKLPYIVVIIDEFADLMATSGKELETTVARLCAMSRAVGIHLVLATQRPSIDVITGLIKANIPSRIAFMVASKMDSRIIIDQIGAEKLLGKGDMLYAGVVDPFPIRLQGTLVNDLEVENVVDYVKTFGEPEYIDDEIFIDDDEEAESEPAFESEGEDPLYEKAVDIVIQAGKASASYIQRRLKIGYNRAARLVEEMEERGIVGPANGSKPREIIHMP